MSSESFSPKFLALLPRSTKPDDLKDSIVGVVGQLDLNVRHHKGTNRRITDLKTEVEKFHGEMRMELDSINKSLRELNLKLAAIAGERSTEKAVKARTWAILTGAFVFGNALLAFVMKLLVK